jgi:hypothetical protein
MRRGLILLALMLLAACAATNRQIDVPASAAPDARRQILLTVHQNSDDALILRGSPGHRYQYRRGYGSSASVERTLNRLARRHGLARVRGWPIASLDVYCEVLEITDGTPVDEMIERLSSNPAVDIAQPMNSFMVLATLYDDPYIDLQRSIEQLDIGPAHAVATGKGVVVALIDSQVDNRHPELRGRVKIRRDLVDDRNARGGELHGTAVAGIIASAANNSVGIVGVAPDVTIAALRACWPDTISDVAATCSSFSLAKALEAAIDLEPNLINLSLSGPEDPLLARLLDRLVANGVIVVAAKSDLEAAAFPASHDGVLAVQSERLAVSAAASDGLRAPSTEVLTTTPRDAYGFFSGSSMAAAHMSGVVALLLERDPEISHQRLAQILRDSTMADSGIESINACRALAAIGAGAICQ